MAPRHGFPNNVAFQGPHGTGKTTLARLLMDEVNAVTLLLNASDKRSVAEVRGDITDFASQPTVSFGEAPRPKWVVMDEADQLPLLTQHALVELAERVCGRTRILYIVNHVSEMCVPLLSQCTAITFAPIPVSDQVRRLKAVASKEGIANIWSDEAIRGVATLARGDMRSAIAMLQIMSATRSSPSESSSSPSSSDAPVERKAAASTPDSKPLGPLTKDEVYSYRLEPTDEFVESTLATWRSTSFADASRETWTQLTETGVSVHALVVNLASRVVGTPMPDIVAKLDLLTALADIESALQRNADPQIQFYALMGAWKSASDDF